MIGAQLLRLLFQRVLMQIVQELCKRPGLNKCGFDMPTIYIPNPNKVRPHNPELHSAAPWCPQLLIIRLSPAESLRQSDRRRL